MSRLSSDRIDVLLTPHAVGLRRVHKARFAARAAFSLWAEADAGGALDWAAPLKALEQLLDAAALPGAEAAICLSNHFARGALMPPSELVVTHDDALRFARHNFERVHGPAASTWSVRASPLPDGGYLASGVDQELVDALRGLLRARKLVAGALQPASMALYNAVRTSLPRAACRLVIAEPGLAVTALLAPQWRQLRTHRLRRAGGAELAHLIERERSLDDEAAAQAPTCLLPLVPLAATALPAGTRVFDPLWIPAVATAAAAAAPEVVA